MTASVPIHARNHRPGGVDPLGGADVDLGRYVIAAVPLHRNLWVGGHGPISSGAEGKTTIACPLIETAGPAPLNRKFYDHSIAPTWTTIVAYAFGYLGCAFAAMVDSVECTGVQFYSADARAVTIKLWERFSGVELASGGGAAGIGWNEIYFGSPALLSLGDDYTVGVSCNDRPTADGGEGGALMPLTAGGLVSTEDIGAPWQRHVTALPDPPATGTNINYAIGPIVDHVPNAGDPRIVATASHGTESGVFVHRTEKGDNVIDIFWSAADAIVAVNVFVMGIDPGGTQDCESERYHIMGACLSE